LSVEKAKRRFKIDIVLKTPKVPYRETVRGKCQVFATPACRTTDGPRPRISPEEMPCQLLKNTIHPRHIHSDGGESVKTDRFTLFIL
ncbi:hypothetical protein, partial [Alistipes finegoldii]|uniref:hypothetical protein n=1 Tax=Alistipes finegoldii TaxID=214856 RepID=UPI003AB147D5